MLTSGVVEHLNEVEDVCPSFVSGFVPGAKHCFDFQGGEEALHRRIVPALATATHTAGSPLIGQQSLEVFAGVLATLIWSWRWS